MKTKPIRPEDKFADRKGDTWSVTFCLPGGHVELFCKARSRSFGTYKKTLRAWLADGSWQLVTN